MKAGPAFVAALSAVGVLVCALAGILAMAPDLGLNDKLVPTLVLGLVAFMASLAGCAFSIAAIALKDRRGIAIGVLVASLALNPVVLGIASIAATRALGGTT